MADNLTAAEWKSELIVELEHRREKYQDRGTGEDAVYWSGVANGLSEALDLIEEIEA